MFLSLLAICLAFAGIHSEIQTCEVLKRREEVTTHGINQIKPGYWIRLNKERPVCFQTKGNSPGIIKAPFDGFLGALKLMYLYGSVSCDRTNYAYKSYWGCSNHPLKRSNNLNIYLTDTRSNQILSNRKDAKFSWYSSQINTPVSSEFIFNSMKDPHYVYRGYEIQLWYGDDKMDRDEDKSLGETCVDVYGHYV